MDFKTMAITATLGGTILLSGLTFTGTLNLTDIKNFGTDWANKIEMAVQNSKDMTSKFNLFKGSVEEQLNEKIALINDLQGQIADLTSQVGAGSVNLEKANNELQRLNEELERANNEVQALKDEFALKDTEVQTAFAEMDTASDLDTTLNLDEQTGTPAPPETPEQTETPETEPTEPTGTDYTAQENAIKTALASKIAVLDNLTVTMTNSTIALTEEHINLADSAVIKGEINKIIGKVPTGPSKNGNTHTYTY